MTDFATQGTDEAASAQAPGVGAAEIERLKAEMTAAMDERVKGLQRLVSGRDETIKALSSELEEFKTAGLSEDERYQLQLERRDKEIQALQAKLEMRDLAGKYGDEMPYFERLLAAGNAEEQLQVMRELRAKASGPAPTEQAPAEPVVPDVDPNNPARSFDSRSTVLPDGTVLNDALVDQILGAGWGKKRG